MRYLEQSASTQQDDVTLRRGHLDFNGRADVEFDGRAIVECQAAPTIGRIGTFISRDAGTRPQQGH